MLAFTNTKVTYKQFYDSAMRHLEADALVQGIFGRIADNAVQFRGCHVGCILHGFTQDYGEHIRFEGLFGIPESIAQLSDRIHENLPEEETSWFFEGMVNAFKEGQDLSLVQPRFILWLLEKLDTNNAQVRDAIERAIAVYGQWVADGHPDLEAARAAARAADAAGATVYAIDRASARAAYMAARATYTAAYAAYAVASAVAATGDGEWWKEAADKLVELVQDAPRP